MTYGRARAPPVAIPDSAAPAHSVSAPAARFELHAFDRAEQLVVRIA